MVANTGWAKRVGHILVPLINQLSYLPYQLPSLFTEDNNLLITLARLLDEALDTVAIDRAVLEHRRQHRPTFRPIRVHLGLPQYWFVRLSHPLAGALCRLLQELWRVEEQWAILAWQAEVDGPSAFDPLNQAEWASYAQWQQERLEWVQELSRQIRCHLKQLRQACQPQAGIS